MQIYQLHFLLLLKVHQNIQKLKPHLPYGLIVVLQLTEKIPTKNWNIVLIVQHLRYIVLILVLICESISKHRTKLMSKLVLAAFNQQPSNNSSSFTRGHNHQVKQRILILKCSKIHQWSTNFPHCCPESSPTNGRRARILHLMPSTKSKVRQLYYNSSLPNRTKK